jgi:hypothetical protein
MNVLAAVGLLAVIWVGVLVTALGAWIAVSTIASARRRHNAPVAPVLPLQRRHR